MQFQLVAHGQGIFGGYVDSTKSWGGQQPESAGGPSRKPLYIRGVAVFGGVEIKN